MGRNTIGPWRAALNWHLAVMLFGSVAATLIVTIPYFALCSIVYGFPPPEPSWTTLRALQILQSVAIAGGGGWLALAYFKRRWTITYGQMRFQLKAIAIAVPLSCILIVLAISIPRYGVTPLVLGSALLIFGSFTTIFLAGSFYFARRLNRDDAPDASLTK
jgi:hypothetical protein